MDTLNISPLVLVGGLHADQPTNEPKLDFQFGNLNNEPLAKYIRHKLVDLSTPQNTRDFKDNKGSIHFEFQNSMHLIDIKTKPTPLSPTNPECKSPIWSPKWLLKYQQQLPSVVVICIDEPVGTQKEDEVIHKVELIKQKLLYYGTHLILVLNPVSDTPYIAVDSMRRRSNTFQRTDCHALTGTLDSPKLDEDLVKLLQEVCTWSDKFFTRKMHYIREKRKEVVSPQDFMVWDTRYTLKLAFCAEFKGDCQTAVKLFESVYDSLKLLFVNNAIGLNSKPYLNAREILDLVVKQLIELYLPSKQAFRKFENHLKLVEMIWGMNKTLMQSKSSINWRAGQYAKFAELCGILENADVQLYVPSGLTWLDSALISLREPEEGGVTDTYATLEEGDSATNPRDAFLNAISSLTSKPRAKSWALYRYARYLEANNDPSAASEAYKSCLQTSPAPMWKDIKMKLAQRLEDSLEMFLLGLRNEFPEDLKTAKTPLFTVSGCFQKPLTFVGKNLKAQVKLVPKFKGKFELKELKIKHSLGESVFESGDAANTTGFITISDKCAIEFSDGMPKVFQFVVSPLQIEPIKLYEVQLTTKSGFTQTIPIKLPSNVWHLDASTELTAPKVKHFLPTDSQLITNVRSRPAKLIFRDNTKSSTVGVEENLKFDFQIESQEDEDIEVDLEIKLSHMKDPLMTKTLKIPTQNVSENITGSFTAPGSLFEMEIHAKFNTSTDTIPVSFTFNKEIDVITPFRVNFGLVPIHITDNWPSVFEQSQNLVETARKWALESTVLSLLPDAVIDLNKCELVFASPTCRYTIGNPMVEVNQTLEHNSVAKTHHEFKVYHEFGSKQRHFETLGSLELHWCRQGSNIINKFTLPPIRLNLPTTEPRVLVTAPEKPSNQSLTPVRVNYHLENPSSAVLNFQISMISSTFFAFQGPKMCNIRLLPCSTKTLTYDLIPLGDGEVDKRRPLPELKVFDREYKKVLAVSPGSPIIKSIQGTLFL